MTDLADSVTVTEDGTLQLCDNIESVSYHPSLNVFILSTTDNQIQVVDPHTSETLLAVSPKRNDTDGKSSSDPIRCFYSPYNDGVFITSGHTVGFRKEHQGVMFFDTALQKQVSNADDPVTLELLRTEATNLYNVLTFPRISEHQELREALLAIFSDEWSSDALGQYSKWKSETVTLPWSTLKKCIAFWIQYLPAFREYFPALPLVAMLLDRTNRMLISHMEKPIEINKENMFSEAVRLSTFRDWPHMDYKWALPEQMAQAGFFHQPGENNDDRAMCFICNVCLVFWEPTDEPWSEHERHSPNCHFVRGEDTQNVPLSYTHATSPAQPHVGTGGVSIVSTGNCPTFVATSTGRGSISLWNVSGVLKKEAVFWIDLTDSVLMDKHFCDAEGFCDIALGEPVTIKKRSKLTETPSCWNENSPVILDMVNRERDELPKNFSSKHTLEDDLLFSRTSKEASAETPVQALQTDAVPIAVPEDDDSLFTNENDAEAVATKNSENMASVDNNERCSDIGPGALTSENSEKVSSPVAQELYVPPRGSQDIKIGSLCVFVPPKESSNTSDKSKSYLAVGASIRKFMLPTKPATSVETEEDNHTEATQKPHVTLFTPYILMYGLNVIKNKKSQKQKKSFTPASSVFGKSSESSPVDDLFDVSSKTLPPESSVADIIMPTIQQCVELPRELSSIDVCINNITSTSCGHYLIVSVKQDSPNAGPEKGIVGALLVYRVVKEGSSTSIEETPVKQVLFNELKNVPMQILQISSMTDEDTLDNILVGYISVNGDVGVFSLRSMSCIFHKQWETEAYTQLVYCTSLERLCAVKKNGGTTLLAITSLDQSFQDDGSLRTFLSDLSNFDCKTSSDPIQSGDIDLKNFLVHQEISEPVLDKCLLLTQLQYGSPRFVATVLPFYSEVVQAQKQRKSPQHLQIQSLDCNKAARTWKLSRCGRNEKKHAIGMVFSSNGTTGRTGFQFGYVELKMVFVSEEQYIPKLQVSLLEESVKIGSYTTGGRKNKDAPEDQKGSTQDTEILDGPIDATEFINPSDNTSTIIMTSPLLMACRSRNFVIHIEAVQPDEAETETDGKQFAEASPKTAFEGQSLSSPEPKWAINTPKADTSGDDSNGNGKNSKGPGYCSALDEISVSFKTFKKTKIPHERLQRLALLEKTSFHESLLSNAINSPSFYIKNRSLDLFYWILTVHSSSCASKVDKPANVYGTLLSNVSQLIRSTILLGDRALAHKTAKILTTAIDYFGRCNDRADSCVQILDGLLDCHLDLMECKSAGALFYYFTLLNSLKHFEPDRTAQKVTALLSRMIPLLEERDNPLHTLLHSKFNLQGLPFEREIFDSQLVFYVKLMHPSSNGKNQMSSNHPALSNPTYPMSGKGLSGNNKNQMTAEIVERNTTENPAFCGLLEVEPLHFVLHVASEGTKMEKVYPGSSYGGNPLFMQPPGGTTHPNGQQPGDHNYSFHKGIVNLNKNSTKMKLGSKTPKEDASTATSSEYTSDGSVNDGVIEGATSDEEEYFPIMPMGYSVQQKAMDLIMGCEVSQHLPSTLSEGFQSGEENFSKSSRAVLSPHMLSLPPQHMLVIDRMHSGARRFVVFDFGRAVVLTDILIPACPDLALITIDTWLTGEDVDGDRLTMFHDISTKPLSMVDLQPPVVCRYLKMMLVGRQGKGMLITQFRVPVGSFFGHTVILPWHLQAGNTNISALTKDVAMAQQPILANMVEDLSCRYSLACSRLKQYLEQTMSAHPQPASESSPTKDTDPSQPTTTSDNEALQSSDKNIFQAYQECLLEQKHLNMVLSVLSRINHFLGLSPSPFFSHQCSTDQLNTLVRYSLNCLLTLTVSPSESKLPASLIEWGDAKQAYVIIENICLRGSRGPQVEAAAAILSRLCSSREWWGEFLCDTLFVFFERGFEHNFCNIRAFTLITLLAFKTCEAGHGPDLVNSVVKRFLSFFNQVDASSSVASLQVPSLRWILLFLCECLEVLAPTVPSAHINSPFREPWSWINGEALMRDEKSKEKKDPTMQSGVYRDRLCKRVSYHKQKLLNLEAASKSFGDVLAILGTCGSSLKLAKESKAAFKKLKHQHTLKHFKDLCSIQQHENASLFRVKEINAVNKSTPTSTSATPSASPSLMRLSYNSQAAFVSIERESALQACKLLIKFVLSPPPAEVDSFILICRVVGGLMMATRPCLRLSEVLSCSDLEELLCQTIPLNTFSGREWAVHAVSCLLKGAVIEEDESYKQANPPPESPEKKLHEAVVEEAKPPPSKQSPIKSTKLENAKCAIHNEVNEENSDGTRWPAFTQLATSSSPPPVSFAYSSNEFCLTCDEAHIPCLEESSDDDCISNQAYKKNSLMEYFQMHNSTGNSTSPKPTQNTPRTTTNHLSCAPTCDSRLENGFSFKSELNLAVYNGFHRDQLNIGLTEPLQLNPAKQNTREEQLYQGEGSTETKKLLTTVFEKALCTLAELNDIKRLEILMEMWLQVNMNTDKPHKENFLLASSPLTVKTMSALLAAFARGGPAKTVRSWSFFFLVLCSCSFMTTESTQGEEVPMIILIIRDKNFVNMLVKFLNGDSLATEHRYECIRNVAGDSLIRIFLLFMDVCISQCKLELDSDASWMKMLYTVVIRLLEDNGALCSGWGPLDAQDIFLRELEGHTLDPVKEKTFLMSLIKGIACAIHSYACTMVEGNCRISDRNSASLGGVVKLRETVLCSLLNMAVITLTAPKEPKTTDEANSSPDSVTEETPGPSEDNLQKNIKEQGFIELINSVVEDEETMDLLLQALSRLSGNGGIFSLKDNLPLELTGKVCLRESVVDALYRLLLHIYSHTTSVDAFVQALLRILKPRGPWCVFQRGEALFLYLSQIFEQPNILKKFTEAGGFKILWQNLLQASKQIGAGQMSDNQRGLVSSVMNHLNPQLPTMLYSPSHMRRVDPDGSISMISARHRSEMDAASKGLYNFAPIANIVGRSPFSRPAEALLQNAPFFPRTREPLWSHHFTSNQLHVDIDLILPCPILLHQVHLQPHNLTLGMSPSSVTVDTSLDGEFHHPATGEIIMAGLTYLKVEFPHPIVARWVRLRLGHPFEQPTVGLEHIRMYGTTALKSLPVQSKGDSNQVESAHKTSAWWLRLIEHCLCNVDGGLQMGVECARETDSVIPTLVSLLTASSSCVNLSNTEITPNGNLENIALSLAKADTTLLKKLLSELLMQPLFVHSLGNTYANSPISLIFNICCNDQSTAGMALMLEWLHKCALSFINSEDSKDRKQSYVTPVLLRCIAAALWSTRADVVGLLNLFRDLSTWRDISLGALKNGLNQILCSMCKIKPIFFVQTLCYMGILVQDEHAENQVTRNENKFGFPACCTDDTKGTIDSSQPDLQIHNMYLPDARDIKVNGAMLRDLANVCQSYEAANLLLDSGFPNLLVQGILAWCKKELMPTPNETDATTDEATTKRDGPIGSTPRMDTALVADSLEAFNIFAAQLPLKEWLGCGEGSAFWLPLLTVLGDPTVRAREESDIKDATSHAISGDYIRLEDATVKLMRECVLFHIENQKILASTLCHLIQKQKVPPSGGMTYLHSLSGFTRRLVLQVLLDIEFVTVLVNSSQGVLSLTPAMCSSSYLAHPQDSFRQNSRVFHLPASTTLEQVLNLVTVKPGSNNVEKSPKSDESYVWVDKTPKSGLNKFGLVSAAINKEKKYKGKGFSPKTKTTKKNETDGEGSTSETTKPQNMFSLCHSGLLGGRGALPSSMTLSQVLSALRGAVPSSKITPWLRFTLILASKAAKVDKEEVEKLSKTDHFPSTLETFTSLGGLSLLAQHMALLYPDTPCQVVDSSIPPHSLGAFTLFLRLPGYAQALLTNPKNACCLLRLAFGANNVADGGQDMSQGYPLATLPFQVLEGLLASTPNSTDDGRMLRKMCLKVGALHLILACLAGLSHQDSPEVIATLHHPNVPIGLVVATTRSSTVGTNNEAPQPSSKADPDRCLYWAKGTGFGTGSTHQNWNVEHAIQRQQIEGQHIVWLLRLLSQYVYPVPTEAASNRNHQVASSTEDIEETENFLPEEVSVLFKSSGLISKIASYLSNDSVLDMSRHIPLYKALMDLIVAISVTPSISNLLINVDGSSSEKSNLPNLLASMMKNVDTYMSKLKIKKKPVKPQKSDSDDTKEDQEEEGLSYLVPYMRKAANLVERLNKNDDTKMQIARSEALELLANGTTSAIYEKVMKDLQFDSFEMIVESTENNDLCFTVPYQYESSAKVIPTLSFSNKRLKRLAQEAVTLSTSLPLSFSSSVFVRTDVDRIDVMKVLITGPEDTPYANGCFEFDVFFPPDYPVSPLLINLQTTGEKKVRFNPNLYQDGKVCLSILNTWHGRPEEKWSPHTSSLLQVLVSIQSLILVPEPYFNEPGYEKARGTPLGLNKSREYDANIRVANIRYAILNQLRNPSPCFKEVIERHFWIKRTTVLNEIDEWIKETEEATGIKNLATHLASLKKLRTLVDEELKKLDPDMKTWPLKKDNNKSEEKTAESEKPKISSQFEVEEIENVPEHKEEPLPVANGVYMDWADSSSDHDYTFLHELYTNFNDEPFQ